MESVEPRWEEQSRVVKVGEDAGLKCCAGCTKNYKKNKSASAGEI